MQDVNYLMQHLIDVWIGVGHSALLTIPLTSGADVSMHAFEPRTGGRFEY